MPHYNLNDGLYLIMRRCEQKGVDHYGILDIGNRLRLPNVAAARPVVLHQTPPRIRFDWLEGEWKVLGKITNEEMARGRGQIALRDPQYKLFGNNCEDVARFIATGRKESTQVVIGVAACLALVGFVVLALE